MVILTFSTKRAEIVCSRPQIKRIFVVQAGGNYRNIRFTAGFWSYASSFCRGISGLEPYFQNNEQGHRNGKSPVNGLLFIENEEYKYSESNACQN